MQNANSVKLDMVLSNGIQLSNFTTASLGGGSNSYVINEFGQITQEGSAEPILFSGTLSLVSCDSDQDYDVFFHQGIAGSLFDIKSRQLVGFPRKPSHS